MVWSAISDSPKSSTLSLKTPMMVKGMPWISKVWPTAASSLPYRSRAKGSVTTAHLMCAASSVSSKKRPSGTIRLRMCWYSGLTPRTSVSLTTPPPKLMRSCISSTGEEYITPGTCVSHGLFVFAGEVVVVEHALGAGGAAAGSIPARPSWSRSSGSRRE